MLASPSNFNATNANANVYYVNPAGELNNGNVTNSFGVRPVINLRSDVLISKGDGTIENPYFLKLS